MAPRGKIDPYVIDFDRVQDGEREPPMLRPVRLEPRRKPTCRQRARIDATGSSRFGQADNRVPLVDNAPDNFRPATVAEIRADRSHMVTGWQVHCPKQDFQLRDLGEYSPPKRRGFTFRPYARRAGMYVQLAPELFAEAVDLLYDRYAEALEELNLLDGGIEEADSLELQVAREGAAKRLFERGWGLFQQMRMAAELIHAIETCADAFAATDVPDFAGFFRAEYIAWRGAQIQRVERTAEFAPEPNHSVEDAALVA